VLQEAAGRAGLDLVLLTLDQLRAAAHLCVTHSEHSMKQYGIPSVAEAAALAGAGAGARLLIRRFVGRNTTASVAGRP
jgi:cobalt-precorrin 5A hydrolase